jgi:hypothetical protein
LLHVVAFADFISHRTVTDVTGAEMHFIGTKGVMRSFDKEDTLFDMYFNKAHWHVF